MQVLLGVVLRSDKVYDVVLVLREHSMVCTPGYVSMCHILPLALPSVGSLSAESHGVCESQWSGGAGFMGGKIDALRSLVWVQHVYIAAVVWLYLLSME